MTIQSCQQLLLDWVGEESTSDVEACRLLHKYVLRYTHCGCRFNNDGDTLHLSGYVEGVDWDFPLHSLKLGEFTVDEWVQELKDADKEGVDAWNDTHGCEDCGDKDSDTGYIAINALCGACQGEGTWF